MATFHRDTGTGILQSAGASTDLAKEFKQQGDAANRFQFDHAGKASWGAGSGAVDAVLARQAAGVMQLLHTATEVFRFGGSTPADTACNLHIYRNVGGTYALVQVLMGTSDSGGTGYKLLRVTNGP